MRALNVRRGMRRSDDKPPENHWKKRFPDLHTPMFEFEDTIWVTVLKP